MATTTKTTKRKSDVETEAVEGPVAVAEVAEEGKSGRYYEAVGRRKTSTARVRLFTKGAGIVVNKKEYTDYFQGQLLRIIDAPLRKMKTAEKFKIEVLVSGGGAHSQAEAVRHGIARALVLFNGDFQKRLKRSGYLKRDPRKKERRKYGLKKARKAPRWSKR